MSYLSLYIQYQKIPYFTAILRTQLAQWQCRSGFLVPAIITNKILSGHSFIFNFKSLPRQLLTFLYTPILLQLIKSSCFGLKLDDGMVFYYVIICFLVCSPPSPFLLACHVFLKSSGVYHHLLPPGLYPKGKETDNPA